FCASWNGRAALTPPWRPHEQRAAGLGRLALPREEPDAVGVLPPDLGDPAGDLRDDRVLHVQGRRARGPPPLRLARRRADGHLVGDAVRFRRGDPVAALAGNARALDRVAGARPARSSAAYP